MPGIDLTSDRQAMRALAASIYQRNGGDVCINCGDPIKRGSNAFKDYFHIRTSSRYCDAGGGSIHPATARRATPPQYVITEEPW